MVTLVRAGHNAKLWPELGVKRLGRIPNYRQPAARRGTILVEGRYEYISVGSDRAPNLRDISPAIRRVGKEMKHRAIVPDRVRTLEERSNSDIRSNPLHFDGVSTEPLTRYLECSLRQIQYGNVGVARLQQIVDQHGSAATNIDDRGTSVRCKVGY